MRSYHNIWALSLLLLLSVLVRGNDAARFGLPRVAIGLSKQGRNPSSSSVSSSLSSSLSSASSHTPTKPSSPTQRPNLTEIRAGSTAAAGVKTMTATQMKAFSLLSGGAAGTISSIITNPLEVIKTQLQSSVQGGFFGIAQRIFKQDGLSGFFRGLPPTLLGIIPSRSIYFYSYQQSRKALGPIMPEGSPGNALISGVTAGLAGNTLTNPIWMVRTRMQLLVDSTAGQKLYTGYGDAIRSIFREEGIGGFYKGIVASYWGCAEGAAQFVLYEQLKTRLLKRENTRRQQSGLQPTDKLSKATYFFSAAFAKGLAAIATYPHEVARTRLREQARSGIFKYTGMWQSIGLIAKEEGTAGLYAGMGVHLLKVVPNSAIMFLTYEIVNAWLGQFTVVEK